MSGPVIWIEGIIASGKSTLTKQLAEKLGMRAIYEPVDDNPMLGKFYKDPKKYAFPMQLWLMAKRYNMQQLAVQEAAYGQYNGAIIDRGLPGDRVFCKMHVDEGNIEPEFWDVYETFYNTMSLGLTNPSLLVFLDVEPETAFKRMNSRNRGVEAGVPLEYLQRLRSGYLNLLSEIESGTHAWGRSIEVMRVPYNVEYQDLSPIVDEIRHRCRL